MEESLKGQNVNHALGRIFHALEEQFSAQPSRQRAFAVAVARDSVDVVVASKAPFGVVTYQHSKPLPLALNKESPGLQQLVATVTASAEASGYRAMMPPPHTPVCCEYVSQPMPMKHMVDDPATPTPLCGTQVYQLDIREHESSNIEKAILKICPPSLINTEARSFKSCYPNQQMQSEDRGHLTRISTHCPTTSDNSCSDVMLFVGQLHAVIARRCTG